MNGLPVPAVRGAKDAEEYIAEEEEDDGGGAIIFLLSTSPFGGVTSSDLFAIGSRGVLVRHSLPPGFFQCHRFVG